MTLMEVLSVVVWWSFHKCHSFAANSLMVGSWWWAVGSSPDLSGSSMSRACIDRDGLVVVRSSNFSRSSLTRAYIDRGGPVVVSSSNFPGSSLSRARIDRGGLVTASSQTSRVRPVTCAYRSTECYSAEPPKTSSYVLSPWAITR